MHASMHATKLDNKLLARRSLAINGAVRLVATSRTSVIVSTAVPVLGSFVIRSVHSNIVCNTFRVETSVACRAGNVQEHRLAQTMLNAVQTSATVKHIIGVGVATVL